ncbi:hypothetical protein GCM10009736_68570 [Actinomadura bangladeshensis]
MVRTPSRTPNPADLPFTSRASLRPPTLHPGHPVPAHGAFRRPLPPRSTSPRTGNTIKEHQDITARYDPPVTSTNHERDPTTRQPERTWLDQHTWGTPWFPSPLLNPEHTITRFAPTTPTSPRTS